MAPGGKILAVYGLRIERAGHKSGQEREMRLERIRRTPLLFFVLAALLFCNKEGLPASPFRTRKS